MTRKRKARESRAAEAPSRRRFALLAGAVVALALAAALFLSRGRVDSAAPPETAPVAAATTAPGEYQAITGPWLRQDGGYVLDIRSAREDGTLDAAYLNPNPIHVAQARAWRDEAAVKVFVELRDVNYPGSTYTLAYDPAADQLRGVYFQAVERQSFDVSFVRAR